MMALVTVIAGCEKIEQTDRHEPKMARAEARRQKQACASSVAYAQLKGLLFDQAIARHAGDRANLDILADYSTARMEEPVVHGWDSALDITHCRGRFILDVPTGAEAAFDGERHLQEDIDYTAQGAADGSGLVYRLTGAERIIAKLAAFRMSSEAYRPPPAFDERTNGPEAPPATAIAQADAPEPGPAVPIAGATGAKKEFKASAARELPLSAPVSKLPASEPRTTAVASSAGDTSEAAVRAFYGALRTGNGAAASAQIVPEKRASGVYSPAAMSRFYGNLPEPVRLTAIAPVGRGKYRVRYRYSAGRSHCNGSAVVSVTKRAGRDFIRSIRALNGC